MNRLFIMLSALLFSTTIFAQAHVGEYAAYDLHTQGYQGEWRNTVESYEAAGNTYTFLSVSNIAGQRSEHREQKAAGDVINRQQIAQILLYCQAVGGTPERISVNGKEYGTCRLNAENSYFDIEAFGIDKSQGGYIWVGDVAATGFVKVQTPELKLEVREYRWN